MIKVNYGNNMRKDSTIVNENTTIRNFLKDVNIDYAKGVTNLDGAPLQPGDFDKTFADFGITSECFLYSVVKVDNA